MGAAVGNLILIGMPGAGKTTVGRLLAARLGWAFLDTDAWLETRHGQSLATLLADRGLAGFRELEAQAVLEHPVSGPAVIATGGSVIYSAEAMRKLARLGTVVFLDCPPEVIIARVGDPAARGMVIAPGQRVSDLYWERLPLYRDHADLTIACDSGPPERLADRLLQAMGWGED